MCFDLVGVVDDFLVAVDQSMVYYQLLYQSSLYLFYQIHQLDLDVGFECESEFDFQVEVGVGSDFVEPYKVEN